MDIAFPLLNMINAILKKSFMNRFLCLYYLKTIVTKFPSLRLLFIFFFILFGSILSFLRFRSIQIFNQFIKASFFRMRPIQVLWLERVHHSHCHILFQPRFFYILSSLDLFLIKILDVLLCFF